RSRNLRTRTRSARLLLLRGLVANERARRCRQDLPLGRKPMLVGLPMRATMCAPDLVGALANSAFQALIHLRAPAVVMSGPFSLAAWLTKSESSHADAGNLRVARRSGNPMLARCAASATARQFSTARE